MQLNNWITYCYFCFVLTFLTKAVTKMIQEAFTYVEQTPDLDTKLKLIDTLRTVTAGKVLSSASKLLILNKANVV